MSSSVSGFSLEGFPLLEEAARASAAPQLVMLANVAAVAAADVAEGSVADDKEMMELKTVACAYSDSEDDAVVRYAYDERDAVDDCSPSAGLGAAQEQHGGRVDAGDAPAAPSWSGPNPPPSAPAPNGDAVVVPAEIVKKKKPFHCKPCHFQAADEKAFVEHLQTHTMSKMEVVKRVEGGGKAAKEAESAQEDPKGLIRCQRCGYNTNRYDHYVAHLKHHGKEGDDHRVFKCTLCAYSTVSQYHWRKHLRNHFPSKLHTCAQCSYFSDRKSNYIQHIRTHTGVRPFQCPYCDYSSSQKTHLTRHMRTHSGERPFKCESCNYLAANQHEVTRHARQVHNGPKPLACPYCQYKTADRSNFKKHVELHLNPRQFLCPLCKYAASKKCNLQYHIKSRHSGCQVTVDVSKVKLRVKKPDGPSKMNPPDARQDFDGEEAEREPLPADKASGPVNLSLAKSDEALHVDEEEEPAHIPARKDVEQENGVASPQKTTKAKPQETTGAAKAKRRVKKTTTRGPHDPQPTRDQSQAKATAVRRHGNHGGKPTRSGGRKSEREEVARSAAVPESLHEGAKGKSKKRKAADALHLSCMDAPKTRRVPTGDTSLRSGSPAKRTRRSARKSSTDQEKATPDSQESSAHSPESSPVTLQADSVPREPSKTLPQDTSADVVAASVKGVSPPPLTRRCGKASDADDDEGVHSSHEGGGESGDVSDGASEGSDDSGLNGNASKDPETPTCEIVTPTELQSHTCIFCDRHFPLEAEYRRHLNRHLVNVYYMNTAAPTSN
ncbi:RE1-silencing transcription factor [Festucalex cinctus]